MGPIVMVLFIRIPYPPIHSFQIYFQLYTMDLSFEESMKFEKWSGLLEIVSQSCYSALNKTSIFKGVTLDKRSRGYKAIIYVNGVQVYIGLYDTQFEAHQAYVKVAKDLSNRDF